jgi:uncharacterized membrane protein
MKIVLAYVASLVIFLVVDMVWLRLIAKDIYASEMGSLIRPDIDLRAAVAFYLLYAAGLTYFAVLPALDGKALLHALALGTGLGLVAYGTYDLTNLAVVKGFGVKIAMIDLAWGAVLSGLSAASVVALLGRSA